MRGPVVKLMKTIKPVVRGTLSEAVFEQLISFVVNGQWKAGDRLPPERELCVELGIARTSLREALKAMELVGMLASRIGDGTYICPRSEFLARPMLWAFTATDSAGLKEILEARTLLEQDLAGLAAENASDAEIASIESLVEEMRVRIVKNQSVLDQDMAFHEAIGSASHNSVLSNSVQLLRNMQREWISIKLRLPQHPEMVLAEHLLIFEAIRDRDVVLARQRMHDHIARSNRLVQRVIQEHTSGGAHAAIPA